jgi:quinol monooxygenase YgiN
MRPPVTVLVTYRPKAGREARFLALLRRHWPTLQRAGLVAPVQPRVWRATDKRTGRRYFVEQFAWKDASASDAAHGSPEVMAIWGPMEPLLESMEIAVVRPVAPAARKR